MNNDKKQICLQYLGLSRKQVEDAAGDYEASIQAVRNLHHYLGLAVEYGCSEREMRFALGWSEERMRSALDWVVK